MELSKIWYELKMPFYAAALGVSLGAVTVAAHNVDLDLGYTHRVDSIDDNHARVSYQNESGEVIEAISIFVDSDDSDIISKLETGSCYTFSGTALRPFVDFVLDKEQLTTAVSGYEPVNCFDEPNPS